MNECTFLTYFCSVNKNECKSSWRTTNSCCFPLELVPFGRLAGNIKIAMFIFASREGGGMGKEMGYSNGSRSDQRQAITLDARLGTCRTQRCVLQVARVRKLDETLLTCQIEFQSRRRLCSTATRLRLGRLVSAAEGAIRSHSVYRFRSRSRSRHQ